MADLAGFRAHAVIGDEETNAELNLYLEASKAYAAGAGVPEPDDDDALYDLMIYRLATFYHDHKAFPEQGKDAEYVGVNGMIIQLRGG